MKRAFTIIVLILISHFIWGQSSFEVLNVQNEVITGNTIIIPVGIHGEAAYSIKIRNISSSQISAKIYKTYLEGPAEGSFDSMCSPETQSSSGSCSTSNQTSTFILNPGETSGPAEMHYEHGSTAGLTSIRYQIKNNNNPDDFVMVILTFSTLTSVTNAQITNFAVYPNPAINNFFVEKSNSVKKFRIEVYDVLGKIVHKSEISSSDKMQIDCSKWDKGYYFVKIYNEAKLEKTVKIVVNN